MTNHIEGLYCRVILTVHRTDLISAVVTGSPRILNYDLFPELAWKRDPLFKHVYKVPVGFEPFADLLGDEFLRITEDINALKSAREAGEVDLRDAISVMHLDNQQASIESRLYDLGKDPLRYVNPTLYCCVQAAFLCAYALFTEVWASGLLPSCLSRSLLERLQLMQEERHANDYSDLFVWITTIGGVFSESVQQQASYTELLRQEIEAADGFMTSESLSNHLEKFIWSRKLFSGRLEEFWNAYEAIPNRKQDDIRFWEE